MTDPHPGASRLAWGVFGLLCFAWGTTWVAIRLGVTAMPPLWFAATRFLVAGVILLAIARKAGGWQRIPFPDAWRLTVMSAGAITICFGLIFWGEQSVDAGTSGVIVQGFVPIGLFFFAAVMGRESIGGRQWLSLTIGLCGVVLLTGQSWSDWTSRRLISVVAIIAGTVVYDWAGVYGGPVISHYPAALMSAFENLVGGLLLFPVAWLLEGQRILRNPLPDRTSIWVSWVYLVIVGSMLGFTAYTYLLRTWGPTRTSAYAFVTPVIALISGAVIAGESISWEHLAGTALVLGAVAGVIRRPARSPSPGGKSQEAVAALTGGSTSAR